LSKVIGILCWYDESPAWLAATVASFAPLFDHLVALDGAYILFPGALEQPASDVAQANTITEVCAAVNLPLTLYRPTEPFFGNEVEKRNKSLQLAATVRESEDDWYCVVDADLVAHYIAEDAKQILSESDHIVAEYGQLNVRNVQDLVDEHGVAPNMTWEESKREAVRGMYRALDGLQYEQAHYVLTAPTSRGKIYLWGNRNLHQPYVDEALDLTTVVKANHRNSVRERIRAGKARDYYSRRDSQGVEKLIHYEWEKV
jgi:hypothetical protein